MWRRGIIFAQKQGPYLLYRLLSILIAVLIIEGGLTSLSSAQGGTVTSSSSYPNCRFGVTITGDFASFDATELSSLNAGWYVNWRTGVSSNEPNGIEHVNVIRLGQNSNTYFSIPSASVLATEIAAKPGQIWFIANEPDSIWQDNLWATIYTDAYYDLYHLIKGVDTTAQVGIGSIVQPTPLRFQYLDIIWETYKTKYTEDIPVDVWNIHSFILREGRDGWGAFIPPGPEFAGVHEGILYDIRDMDNLDIFWQRIVDFRKWMAQHGQRNKPLFITEYGILFPEDYEDEDKDLFSQSRVIEFMHGGFDLMRNRTDATLGYPNDNNRLVQRWAWFSIDEDSYGGSLFYVDTGAIRGLGKAYREYTATLTPTASLKPTKTETSPAAGWITDAPITFTLKADIANSGNISTTSPITVTFYEGVPQSPGPRIGVPQVITQPLAGCGNYTTVSVTWTSVSTGTHPYFVQIESADDPLARTEIRPGIALVAMWRVYLPVLSRDFLWFLSH